MASPAICVYVPPWRVDVTVRRGVPRIVPRSRLARAIRGALAAVGAPAPGSVGLVLSDDRELAELNRLYLGESGPTDVVSFPLLPPSAFPPHAGEPATRRIGGRAPTSFVLPPRTRPHLGDVVVSVERAIAQARSGRGGQECATPWSPQEELLLLVTHGTLHLCGWDHADPAEGEAMHRLERELLGAD